MIIHRNESGNLHREGLPAVEIGKTKMFFWNGRLHNSRGPAVTTEHGFSYFWRGLHIPENLWNKMFSMSADEILKEPNVEIRRAILERVGFDKVKERANCLDSQTVEGGKNLLLHLDLEEDEPLVFLELINSTPEPDGSRKHYFLRVPPDTRSVKQGVQWTFDIEGDFSFLVET